MADPGRSGWVLAPPALAHQAQSLRKRWGGGVGRRLASGLSKQCGGKTATCRHAPDVDTYLPPIVITCMWPSSTGLAKGSGYQSKRLQPQSQTAWIRWPDNFKTTTGVPTLP